MRVCLRIYLHACMYVWFFDTTILLGKAASLQQGDLAFVLPVALVPDDYDSDVRPGQILGIPQPTR